jgi:hypothetical protein
MISNLHLFLNFQILTIFLNISYHNSERQLNVLINALLSGILTISLVISALFMLVKGMFMHHFHEVNLCFMRQYNMARGATVSAIRVHT